MCAGVSFVLLLSACGKKPDAKKKDDHGHAHGPGNSHDHAAGDARGVFARLVDQDGKDAGFIELKLHDDKGDLELWIGRDAKIATPFDVPLDSRIKVLFSDKGNRTVELRVRNRDKNEDEEGKPTIRDGKTNYFIFPGDTKEDASWLKGETFSATTQVSVEADGKTYTTPNFVLRPHSHGSGHDHKH
jgi:hypothetical protein